MPSFEFQALDRFKRYIRGRVIADTEEKALELVKNRGYRVPYIWETGTKPWMARGKPWAGGDYHTPLLKLKTQNLDTIVYQAKIFWHISILFLLIGFALISYPLFYHNNIALILFGAVFLSVGYFLFFVRFEVRINKPDRNIIIRMRIVPFKWKSQTIDTGLAKKIIVRKDVLYATAGEIYYTVNLIRENDEYQLDASSSKKAEMGIGQKISDFLRIPLVYEEIDNSPTPQDIEQALSLISFYRIYKHVKTLIIKILR